jgi:hypothetical protein
MKPVLMLFRILFVSILLISCGEDKTTSDHHEEDSHSTDHFGKEEYGFRLNDGQKWKMDDHTRSSFIKMTELFLNMDHMSLEGDGLKKAGSDLQGYVGELIKGCTMTGEAHDQLHIYLMGYTSAVTVLAMSGKLEDANKVKHHLEIYDDYFE